ncbi:MAG: (2Fe-2S)-binding protein [Niastella sp.]|nr:(2Fe-2S)-binding protein [Niastella sp.]
MINITVLNKAGEERQLEAPEDMGLNLMEILKAHEYNVLATCGGMAMCGTCHVQVLEGGDNLAAHSDAELDMLDTLPDAEPNSRLACQLRVDENMNGAVFKLCAEEDVEVA